MAVSIRCAVETAPAQQRQERTTNEAAIRGVPSGLLSGEMEKHKPNMMALAMPNALKPPKLLAKKRLEIVLSVINAHHRSLELGIYM